MALMLSVTHDEFRSIARKFLIENCEGEFRRAAMDSAEHDGQAWRRMTDELGLTGLAIPEEFGGAGGTFIDLVVALEETGRSLAVVPFLPTVVAGQILLRVADTDARYPWLSSIAGGSVTGAVALDTAARGSEVAVIAAADGDRWLLNGKETFVIGGATAGLVIVSATDSAGVSGLYAVEGTAEGLTRNPLPTVDLTLPLAHLEFRRVQASRLTAADSVDAVQHATDILLCAVAADQVGGIQRCLEMAVDYAKTRIQFGRPIGSFQAIKHSCAEMWLEVEAAKSSAYSAWEFVDHGGRELSEAAALAKAYCSRAYSEVAKRNIQIHGGIGITWEHDSHLFLKRAKTMELIAGTPAIHKRRLAELVGI